MDWFSVDKEGLKNLLGSKGPEFVVAELIQNGWDQKGTTRLTVSLEKISRNYAKLIVTDDDPEGFSDLAHAFTLFADTSKRTNPTQRGRFNFGEKRVLALCRFASISSTTGTVIFDKDGRKQKRTKRNAGSEFVGEVQMTNGDVEHVEKFIQTLLPPRNIETTFNGQKIEYRKPIKTISTTLPTEIASALCEPLRRTSRATTIEIHIPKPGELACIYEMGIPVVETGDKYHVNVMQKVPLNIDRDNVTPSFLQLIRTIVLNNLCDDISEDEANTDWVRAATSDERCSDEAIGKVLDLRFGNKRVGYDPSDPEANNKAFAQGYTVVKGPQMSKTEWQNAKRASAILPAGQVTPAKIEFDGMAPRWNEDELTQAMKKVRAYTITLANRLMNVDLDVIFLDAKGLSATYCKIDRSSANFVFYVKQLGVEWFERVIDQPLELDALLIHEFGHQYSSNHLDHEYYDALCSLGAKLKLLAMQEPQTITLS